MFLLGTPIYFEGITWKVIYQILVPRGLERNAKYLEEGVAYYLPWDSLVALSPRIASIPKHSAHAKHGFLCKPQNKWVCCHWWHRFKARIFLPSLEINAEDLQAQNVLALLKSC